MSSFETIRVQTNFPGMETARYDLDIGEFERPERRELLRDVFFAPHRFRERLRSVDAVTRETASLFQSIVVDMEAQNEDPERWRAIEPLVFCLYSEDAACCRRGCSPASWRSTTVTGRPSTRRSAAMFLMARKTRRRTRSPTSMATCSAWWTRWS